MLPIQQKEVIFLFSFHFNKVLNFLLLKITS